jgi:hypothetical protein
LKLRRHVRSGESRGMLESNSVLESNVGVQPINTGPVR